ncbi:MAG: 2-keto-4-pentenoate hydratase, partial [Candidatus Binatia bacterium]
LRPLPLGELVAFVADTLGDYGQGLEAGDLIMSGSFIDPFPLNPGATANADFAGLGSVSVTLSGS